MREEKKNGQKTLPMHNSYGDMSRFEYILKLYIDFDFV